MSVASQNEGKKWVQTGLAVACITLGYVLISLLQKVGDWFLLEAKIPYYGFGAQALGVVGALATYVYVLKNPVSSTFLNDVFQELLKVVWPDKNQTWRHTLSVMILVTILGFVFGFFDFGANYLLSLINS
jgi:preprotein translocase subunit SecE